MLSTPDPRTLARRIEHTAHLPPGTEERFSGYGVMGLTFTSGHILALRRFPHSSLGPGYTSIWHYAPDKGWTFYATVEPSLSCPRYFGREATAAVTTNISITWTGPYTLVVSMERPPLEWMLQLSSTTATRIFNVSCRMCPERMQKSKHLLRAIARSAEPTLGAGTVAFQGRVPNGQTFIAVPRLIWVLDRGAAVLERQDLGRITRLDHQIRLADFWIPRRGVFAVAQAYVEPFDATRHFKTAAFASLPS